MSYIRVYDNDNTDQFIKVKLYYQFNFYYYSPYILIEELRVLHPNAIGVLALDERNEKVAPSKRGERIYLDRINNIPVEHGCYILSCSKESNTNTDNTCLDAFGHSQDDMYNIRRSLPHMGCNSDILVVDDKEKCLNQLHQRRVKNK
ncbi:unnamed protein product [Rotaria socialis]|uniref:Uncharacterized protein n=2 Tax=Rotaria socialis TaxID=392032 RepID=A0A818B229_9BILA|nr:unnamed protein product [Rotaria socialis]